MINLITCICLTLLAFNNLRAQQNNSAVVETLAQTTMSWDGNELPNYAEGKPEITILRITIPPGVELPAHKHPVINAGILLKGKLTVITENSDTLHLTAGESIVEVVNRWHYGKNDGSEPVEIIVFYAGIKDEPVTLKNNSH